MRGVGIGGIVDRIDSMQLATDERTDLAEFVEQLTPQQWDAATLCTGWRVRDVVAHALGYDELSPAELAARFAKGRFAVNRINALGVEAYAHHTPAQLCGLVRDHVRPSGLSKGFGGRIALTDNMIHQQDIRRPLGLPRTIPHERLRVALDFARTAPLIRRGVAGTSAATGGHGPGLGGRLRPRSQRDGRGVADGDGRPPGGDVGSGRARSGDVRPPYRSLRLRHEHGGQ
ncbi:hypothetical protein BH10ACT9_BH10ACT9_58730 [soil metagenome]